jgi:hypothetical protein
LPLPAEGGFVAETSSKDCWLHSRQIFRNSGGQLATCPMVRRTTLNCRAAAQRKFSRVSRCVAAAQGKTAIRAGIPWLVVFGRFVR